MSSPSSRTPRPKTASPSSLRARSAKTVHRPLEVIDENGVPYVVQRGSAGGGQQPWCPGVQLSLKLFLTFRMVSAWWSLVSDCDETFNYWEPLHFFLYGKGFQTWEYDPQYGLRSYLYILVHTVPLWIYDRILSPHRMYVFFVFRALLAAICSSCEVYFVKGIQKEMGPNVARISMALLLFSPGMFISATAFLPSSTSMYLTLLSAGAWFHRNHAMAILFTALSAFLSWPFAALVGVPIALDVVFRRRRLVFFVRWCVISVLTILIPQILIDTQFYGKLTIAPLNIVTYNMFTSHGPDLYGTEPWSFYLFNGLLNFNLAFLLALGVYPVLLFANWLIPKVPSDSSDSLSFIPKWLALSGLFLWLAVFWTQPHKEERFLFPVYPLIALAAAVTIDSLQKIFFKLFVLRKNRHYLSHTNWLSISVLTVSFLLSASRIVGLYVNYSAPISTWMHVSHLGFNHPELYSKEALWDQGPVNICVGKEWHRFPSSFYLPDQDWHLKFLRSEFRGQLPQPYLEGEDATTIKRDGFNDLNKEEFSRYDLDSIDDCDFVVDLEIEGKETQFEPIYSKDRDRWEIEAEFSFLDAEKSHKLFRAFYVPFVSDQYCTYSRYLLLKNRVDKRKRLKLKKQQREKTDDGKKKKIRHL